MDMKYVKIRSAGEPEYKPPNQIIGKVHGITEIVLDPTSGHARKFPNAPYFYRGKVRCGKDGLAFREATILAFLMCESDRVVALHHCLSSFSHPCILNSLGYGYGFGEHEGYIFLAFPCFKSTFADFMDKSCKRTVDLKRFTEDFIGLIECVVYALLELHSHRYYCPNLRADQIIILEAQNSVRAKLWDFCALELGNEKGKDMDWVRLGLILRKTAKNHGSYTAEIADLCEDMIKGTLKGIDILKHSALLSVRIKFDNILALNTFALAYCEESKEEPVLAKLNCNDSEVDNVAAMNQLFCDSSDRDKTIASFKTLLDSDVGWKKKAPLWIQERMRTLNFSLPNRNTFRSFLWEIRCLIEHENSYVPPEVEKKISSRVFEYSNIKPDLEYEVRQSWSYLFLTAQKFVTSLQLKKS